MSGPVTRGSMLPLCEAPPVACEECGSQFRAELVDVPGGDVMTTQGRRRCRWCLMAAWAQDIRARGLAWMEAAWRRA